MKNLFYLIILTVLFVTSAMAQGVEEPTGSGVMTKLNLSGVQSSAGKVDELGNVRIGNAFVLNGADADLSYHFTMSMDYTAAEPDYEIGNQIVSGTWSVTVYKNNSYFGSMYGEISAGTIRWYEDPTIFQNAVLSLSGSRDTEVQLTITGGIDGYAGQSPVIMEKSLVATSKLGEKDQTVMEATIELPISQR